jgi:thiol-disulfide isomerase/thioredoxin
MLQLRGSIARHVQMTELSLNLPHRIALVLLLAVTLPASAAPLPPGAPAPAFTRTGFDGRPVSLSAARGRQVLMDFWASWCAPCIVELPHLMDLQKRHAGKL